MKTTLVIWTCVALIAGLLTGYRVGGSSVKNLMESAEANLHASAARFQARETQLQPYFDDFQTRVDKLETQRGRLLNDLAEGKYKQEKLAKELAMQAAYRRELEKRYDMDMTRMRAMTDRVNETPLLTAKTFAAMANAFHDVEHEVARGKFPGLNQADGYEQLKAMLDNPEVERFLADYDETVTVK